MSAAANGYGAKAGDDVVAVIFTDDLRGDSGRLFERLLRARLPSATVYYVDEASATWLSAEVLEAVRRARVVIAPIYLVPVPGRAAGLDIEPGSGELLRAMLRSAASKTVVLAMGSPYLASIYPDVQNYFAFTRRPRCQRRVR